MNNTKNNNETKTLNLTAYNLPNKTETWHRCECCGDFALPEGFPGKFSGDTAWPVTHTYCNTVLVFKDREQVESYVNRAINLLGNHPQNGTGAEEWIDFSELFGDLLEERNEHFSQLLHLVHDFECMLRRLFGERPEIHDDAVVWAFACIMHLLCGASEDETAQTIHGYWDSVMFDSAERVRGIRDAAITK